MALAQRPLGSVDTFLRTATVAEMTHEAVDGMFVASILAVEFSITSLDQLNAFASPALVLVLAAQRVKCCCDGRASRGHRHTVVFVTAVTAVRLVVTNPFARYAQVILGAFERLGRTG